MVGWEDLLAGEEHSLSLSPGSMTKLSELYRMYSDDSK